MTFFEILRLVSNVLAIGVSLTIAYIITMLWKGRKAMLAAIAEISAAKQSKDVEQDIETFDEGYLTGLVDYLNIRFQKHLEHPGAGGFDQDCKHFTRYVLSQFNAMPKITPMGSFTIDTFSRIVVFESHKKEHAL